MMCTTCFDAAARCGEIESTIATGPSTGSSSPIPTSSRSSRWSASTRLSPELTPPPGSSQYSRPCFSWRQRSTRSCQRRIALTRMRGSSGTRAESPLAALASRQRIDFDRNDLGDREDDELRDAHPGLDDERLSRIGVQENDLQLAAITRVDEPRRVDDRDPVLGGKAGARLHEPGVTVRNRDRQPGADERTFPRPELDALARR